MEAKTYTKLSALVDHKFKVESVDSYVFKRWNPQTSKMEVSDSWQEGYRKIYPVTTDKGQLDLGQGQLASLLEACFYQGKSDLIGKTFHVKSNGKMGMDIRYFFNVAKDEPRPEFKVEKKDTVYDVPDGEEVPLDSIPF